MGVASIATAALVRTLRFGPCLLRAAKRPTLREWPFVASCKIVRRATWSVPISAHPPLAMSQVRGIRGKGGPAEQLGEEPEAKKHHQEEREVVCER